MRNYEVFKTNADEFTNRKKAKTIIESSHAPDEIAQFARILITEWGKIPWEASTSDEDSSGRQKTNNIGVPELVGRAFAAATLWEQFAFERGHMIALPSVRDENEMLKDES